MKITIITNEYSAEGGGLSYSCQQIHHLLDEEIELNSIVIQKYDEAIQEALKKD